MSARFFSATLNKMWSITWELAPVHHPPALPALPALTRDLLQLKLHLASHFRHLAAMAAMADPLKTSKNQNVKRQNWSSISKIVGSPANTGDWATEKGAKGAWNYSHPICETHSLDDLPRCPNKDARSSAVDCLWILAESQHLVP